MVNLKKKFHSSYYLNFLKLCINLILTQLSFCEASHMYIYLNPTMYLKHFTQDALRW